MAELLATTWTELAYRSSDGLGVTLVWVQGDGEDRPDFSAVAYHDSRLAA